MFITRWNDFDRTFAALEDFRRRMDRVFEVYDRQTPSYQTPSLSDAGGWPRTMLQDEGSKLSLYAEVPGLDADHINLTLTQDVLTVSGERLLQVPEGYTLRRQERGNFKFSRSFALPCPVDPEKTTANVKDGVLTISLEKMPEAKPRQITVKAS